ncbi:MAG: TIGR02757 family protein [Bacteroidales bacterium]|nr:TIGR02757 family protein [Bacteroidales bacterium]
MNAEYLKELAARYNNKSFIEKDPVSFPHKYTEKRDIETAAFVAQWFAYGKREAFLKILNDFALEISSPYLYIKNQGYRTFKDDNSCLYRFYKKNDFFHLCNALHHLYFIEGKGEMDFEQVVLQRLKQNFNEESFSCEKVLSEIISLFANVKGIPQNLSSACKRLCMFLRWMVRQDNIVDFGLWTLIAPTDLIIPVDTDVYHQARALGLTSRKSADFKTAKEITENLKNIFPDDPLLGDFALFGFGVNNK